MGLSRAAIAASAFVFSLTSINPVEAAELPPAEAFGSLPKFSQPRLSPDGKFLASIQEVGGRPVVVIRPTAGGEPKGTAIPDMITSGIKWVKSDRLVFIVRTMVSTPFFTKSEHTYARAISVNTDASDLRMLLADEKSHVLNPDASTITDINLDSPSNVLMPLTVTKIPRNYNPLRPDSGLDYFRTDLLEVNVRDGSSERLIAGKPNTVEYFTDGHGHVIARLDGEPRMSIHFSGARTSLPQDKLFRYSHGRWSLAANFTEEGDNGAGIVGVAEDGTSLVRSVTAGFDKLYKFDLEHGENTDVIFDSSQYDYSYAITDEWTGRIIGAAYAAEKMEYHYFDRERQDLQLGIERAFPGKTAHAVSETLDRSLAIVAVTAPRQPTTYFLLDRQTHVATQLAQTYPQLKDTDLGEMKAYDYPSGDGLTIPAFITLPPGRLPKNLPAVVLPHGGPDSRDYITFDWWAQFLANRGYVVLQPNFRGSSGYGRKFTELGFTQWGLKIQDDITDGVKKMISDGIVDPKRICIVGASFGGYAALAGATLTPDIYACSASIAGISNLPLMLRLESVAHGRDSSSVSFWRSRMGALYDRGDQLRATSPALHADKVRGPVLLMHPENDTTVPIEQSEEMESALKRAGKKVRFVRLPGDDHYLSLSETRIRMLTELEAFLAANIGPGRSAAN